MSKYSSTERRKADPKYGFYNSPEWKAFRARMVARLRGQGCSVCGRPFGSRDNIHLDHYPHPIKTHWHLRLDPRNVRCLHAGCHTDHTHRPEAKVPTNADGFPPDWA